MQIFLIAWRRQKLGLKKKIGEGLLIMNEVTLWNNFMRIGFLAEWQLYFMQLNYEYFLESLYRLKSI